MGLSTKSVLMVDDDHEDVYTIRKALKKTKVQIDFNFIDSGIKFLEILKESSESLPDVVLLDINMPRMNGYDVLSELRENEQWKDLTVVMLTTSSSEVDRKKLLEMGASAFVTKPHTRSDMTKFIYQLEEYM